MPILFTFAWPVTGNGADGWLGDPLNHGLRSIPEEQYLLVPSVKEAHRLEKKAEAIRSVDRRNRHWNRDLFPLVIVASERRHWNAAVEGGLRRQLDQLGTDRRPSASNSRSYRMLLRTSVGSAHLRVDHERRAGAPLPPLHRWLPCFCQWRIKGYPVQQIHGCRGQTPLEHHDQW